MTLRQIDEYMMRLCERRFSWTRCVHWKANLVLVIGSALAVALTMRSMVSLLLFVVPMDSWAGTFVIRAWMVGDGVFYASSAVSALGGATSLLRELRTNPQASFSILHAIGHMFSAQFAGLMTLIGCLHLEVPPLLTLLGCGMAGWAGNAWLVRLDKWASNRVFPSD